MMKFYGDGPKPSSTPLGVQGLILPGSLVEIDRTAAVDG